jgi:hypothetical protein
MGLRPCWTAVSSAFSGDGFGTWKRSLLRTAVWFPTRRNGWLTGRAGLIAESGENTRRGEYQSRRCGF